MNIQQAIESVIAQALNEEIGGAKCGCLKCSLRREATEGDIENIKELAGIAGSYINLTENCSSIANTDEKDLQQLIDEADKRGYTAVAKLALNYLNFVKNIRSMHKQVMDEIDSKTNSPISKN